MKMEKKITIAKNNISNYLDFFKCPLCDSRGGAFELRNFSLVCEDKHTYDLAKKGYVNLFNGYTKITKTYDKHLFTARKTVSDGGLYSRLCDELCGIIAEQMNRRVYNILDAGCGCGNLTHEIFEQFHSSISSALMAGVDLSKEGIEFAAANFCENDLVWIVGNLNNLPFADAKFDVILNIMSPANYQEFGRVLRSGGVLIKVLPDADYLKELRRFIYNDNDKNEYSNKDVLNNLAENTTIKELRELKYTHSVAASNVAALFDMTPLTSNISEREQTRERLVSQNKNWEVTLAFKIAICEI